MDHALYLLVLGERQAIAWVLSEQRMASPRTPRPEVNRLAPGDELLIYTTRGAFGNPTRDRDRIAGDGGVGEEPVGGPDVVSMER